METETNSNTGAGGVAIGGLATGIVGSVLGLLNGGAGLLSLNRTGGTTTPQWVSKEEYEAGQQIAAKDSEIALLKADANTNTKIIDTYKEVMSKVNDLAAKVQSNKDEQYGVNMAQAVYNGTNTATVQSIQNQVTALQGITKTVVPNSSVCPGWGDVTITPVLSA